MISYFIIYFVFILTDHFFADLIPAIAAIEDHETVIEIARSAIAAAIWVPYFLKSERVKNTFTKGIIEQNSEVYSDTPLREDSPQ